MVLPEAVSKDSAKVEGGPDAANVDGLAKLARFVSIEEAQKSATMAGQAAAEQALGAYSWSVSGLRNSSGAALDAYSWSVEVATNATAAVIAGVGSLQYPALLPPWFNRIVDRGAAQEVEAVEAASSKKEADDALQAAASKTEDLFVLGLGFAWLLESIGPLSLAGIVTYLADLWAIPEPLALFFGCEAAFYLLCSALAIQSNSNPALGEARPWVSVDQKRRREIWRRMMRDPSQSSRDWIEGWMFRKADVVESSPAELIVQWAARRAGLQAEKPIKPPASAPGERVLVEPYGVPWEELFIGDVYQWLCRTLYFKESRLDLTPAEDVELRELVDELEQACGARLRRQLKRSKDSKGEDGEQLSIKELSTAEFPTNQNIGSMVGAMDPLRWRHRPLSFYAISDWVNVAYITPKLVGERGFKRGAAGKLTYWHRPGNRTQSAVQPDALVFIHGIGFGVFPYVQKVEQMASPDVDIVMIELPANSQRLFPQITPTAGEFGEQVIALMDRLGLKRCVVAGHSLGSAYATYFARYDANTGSRRVGGVVLIDPIATNLHHARTSREVIFTRLDSAQASFEDYFFKKELWNSIFLQRKFEWYEASYWLEECVPQTPTLIAVGTEDTIVTPRAISQAFGSWQARLRGVRVLAMEGLGHGGWLLDDEVGDQLVASVHALRSEAASVGLAEAVEAAIVASEKAAEATSKAAAEVTSKASAGLAAATEPLTDLLAPFVQAYYDARSDAEQARSSFEKEFARATAEANRSFQTFESDVVKFSGQSEEAMEEFKVQQRLEEVRRAFQKDFTRAAYEVVAVAERSLSEQLLALESGEVARVAKEAEAETKRQKQNLESNLATAASRALASFPESLNIFERELTGALEAAAAATAEAERARVALINEASSAIKGFRDTLVQQQEEPKVEGRVK